MCDFSGCNSVFQLHTKYLDYLQNVRLNLKILELHRTINFVERNLLSKQIEKIVEKEEERRYEKFITKSNILEKYQNVFHNKILV